MKRAASLIVMLTFLPGTISVPSAYGDIPREKSLYEQAEDKIEQASEAVHEWAGTADKKFRPSVPDAMAIGVEKRVGEGIEYAEEAVHEWAGTAGKKFRPNILNAAAIGIEKKLREKVPGYAAVSDAIDKAVDAVSNGVENAKEAVHEWAGTAGKKFRPSIPEAIEIGVGNRIEDAEEAVHEWAGTADKKFRPSVPEAIAIGAEKRIEPARKSVTDMAAAAKDTIAEKFKTAYQISSLSYTAINNPEALPGKVEELFPVVTGGQEKNTLPKKDAGKQEKGAAPAEKIAVTVEISAMGFGISKTFGEPGVEIFFPGKETLIKGAGMVRDAAYKAKDTLADIASTAKDAVFGKEQAPMSVSARTTAVEPVPQEKPAEIKPAIQPEQSGKVDELASRIDGLLSGISAPQEGRIAGGTMDIGSYIRTVTSPAKSIDVMIKESDEFREDLIESGDYWEFSGIVPNWDGGVMTVDIPTYEEIIQWQQEQEAIAAAAALIGAAVAAGIAASQEQESSGGGESAPAPQQYEKSGSSCGPC